MLLLFITQFVLQVGAVNVGYRLTELWTIPLFSTDKSAYGGYNVVATRQNNNISIAAGAPFYIDEDNTTSGAIVQCFTPINISSDFNNVNWTCEIAVQAKDNNLGDNHLLGNDAFGATLKLVNENTESYLVCSPDQQKYCYENLFIPGSCYVGQLSNLQQIPDWGEIACFQSDLDVVLLVDGSNSIGANDFALMKQFLIDLIQTTSHSLGDTTQIAVVQYGDEGNSKIPVNFGTCFTFKCYEETIRNNASHFRSANTFTAAAIMYTITDVFSASKNKLDSEKILVVITDGASTDSENLLASYNATRDNNITVYAIGVGSDINVKHLGMSANGGVDNSRVLNISSYTDLSTVLAQLTEELAVQSIEGNTDTLPNFTAELGQTVANRSEQFTLENAMIGLSAAYSNQDVNEAKARVTMEI